MAKTLNYNGVPIWALVFYLMRCVLYTEAAQLAQSNADAFNKFDKNSRLHRTFCKIRWVFVTQRVAGTDFVRF